MVQKRYNICMEEMLHGKLVVYAKKKKYDSFSHLMRDLGRTVLAVEKSNKPLKLGYGKICIKKGDK
jgi:hypothetical protein